jgi:hypothetical protein
MTLEGCWTSCLSSSSLTIAADPDDTAKWKAD